MNQETGGLDVAKRAQALVDAAIHESVTAKRLTKSNTDGILTTGYLFDEPVINRLNSDEQPNFIFTNQKGVAIANRDGETALMEPDLGGSTFLVVTDERLIFITGMESGDVEFSIPYEILVETKFEAKHGQKALAFETPNEAFSMPLSTFVLDDYIQKSIDYVIKQKNRTSGDSGEIQPIAVFKTVCRECRELVQPDAERCPHCQYSPKTKKRGLLYWTGVAALSAGILAPVSAYGLYKGAKRQHKASKGVPVTTVAPAV